MQQRVTRLAPAKINLWLRVLGKREDGFHAIETRMVALALADRLEIEVTEGTGEISLECPGADLPTGSDNLAYAAAQAFLDVAPRPISVSITLTKMIPAGAGLGGGSSDAAAVLLALDELSGAGLGVDGLSPLAAKLGSDIPFFLYGEPCDCRGRGELVQPAGMTPPNREVLLVKPEFPVSTPWAYGAWSDSREIPVVGYAEQASPWGGLVNHLERPVFSKHLVLADTKEWLLAQPEVEFALMSGSGSTTFALLYEGAQMSGLQERAGEYFGAHTWLCPTQFAGNEGDLRPARGL